MTEQHTQGRLTWDGRFAGEHDESGATIRAADGSFFASTYGGLTYASTPEEWARYHATPATLVARWNAFEPGGDVARMFHALEAVDALMVRWDAARSAGEAGRNIEAAWRLATRTLHDVRAELAVEPGAGAGKEPQG